MKNIKEIASQISEISETICLIYAFNATGKTKLSVAFKDITKENNDGKHTGVYYNAYSEDLFVWDNDEEHNNENIKLDIIYSSLNKYHSLLLDSDLLEEKLSLYLPRYKFKLNIYEDEDREKGIQSITFYINEDTEEPIKISRGEERIFIWCFFLALFETDSWSEEQDAHFFIDDPVSSMDEHNIFTTAESITKLINDTYPKKKIILTTHHIGLFSILADRMLKGQKSEKYKSDTAIFLLERNGNEELRLNKKDGAFLFHLHLLKTLDQAAKTELFSYHFVLLRQLLENISSFLGKGGIGYSLSQIELDEDPNVIGDRINSLSHKDSYKTQSNKMSENEENLFKDILEKIILKYKFKF
ncbi:AAA family ATPase [Chryseobacterium indologenes]|uniref:AAA family ATPase n=1 Tax=Chryseobacterium indologenes TaxID=253 RepID=UPI001627A4C3|nr:AAA family ATPase [Chryseobacterium indologenes]